MNNNVTNVPFANTICLSGKFVPEESFTQEDYTKIKKTFSEDLLKKNKSYAISTFIYFFPKKYICQDDELQFQLYQLFTNSKNNFVGSCCMFSKILKKDGKLYFLMYFGSSKSYFTIGKIFLKKYFFTFNQETKMIGYYNIDLPGGKKNNRNNDIKNFFYNNLLFCGIILFILMIIFGFLGFFLGKLVYDKVRKKRINEVDESYDYNPQENDETDKENNLIINDNNAQKVHCTSCHNL